MKNVYYILIAYIFLLIGCDSRSETKHTNSSIVARGDGLETVFVWPQSTLLDGYGGKFLEIKDIQAGLTAKEDEFMINVVLEAKDSARTYRPDEDRFQLFLNITDDNGSPSPSFIEFTGPDSNVDRGLVSLFQTGKGDAFVTFTLHVELEAEADFSLKNNQINARYKKDKYELKRRLEKYKENLKKFRIFSVKV